MSASRRRLLGIALGAGAGLAGASLTSAAPPQPIGDEGVGPGEDLMREHGVLNRILLIYEEGIRRIRARQSPMPEALHEAADIIRRFLEGYHEKLEEEHLFPRFEKAGRLVELVAVLRRQHQAGRRLTAAILDLTKVGIAGSERERTALAEQLALFVRMYRPHEAREDTVLFPAFRELVTKVEYERLGDAFESQETKLLGERGFERVVDEVAGIEKSLGIGDLAAFTPAS